MTDPAIAQRSDALRLRIASAIVLIPIALAAVWLGPPWITGIVGVAGLAMAWELSRLASARSFGASMVAIVIAVALAIGAAAAHWFSIALVVAVFGAVAAGSARRANATWIGVGTIWIAVGCVAFLWLAETQGRPILFWLLAVVWATDIFAYFVGKSFGGPRLAPRLSPNKTWAGFAGGLLGGGLAGIAAAFAVGSPILPIAAISLGLSLIAQGGDLAESWAKRHFAVKDTSGLIPGHGGVLDRLDGLLAATQVLALLTFVSTLHFG